MKFLKISPTWLRLLTYLRPYRGRFALALLAMAAYGATDGVLPIIIREVLDNVFGKKDQRLLYLLPLFMVIFAIFRGAAGFYQQFTTAHVGLQIVRDIRNAVNQRLLILSDSFFLPRTSGSLISRVMNDTLLIRLTLTDAVASILKDSIRVIALVCAALYLDPVLGMIAFVGVPLAIWPVVRFGKRVRKLSKVGQETFAGLTAILQETIIGNRVVKAFGMERFEQERFESENEQLTKTLVKAEKYAALSQPTNEIVASAAIAAVILYGGLTVISGVRTQGSFFAFILSLFLLYEPLKKLGRVNANIQMGLSAAERLFEVLDAQPDVHDRPDAQPLTAQQISVEFRNVWFQYPRVRPESETEELPPALCDVSFSLPAGKTLALVGMSGGGKSTIVSLLPRFYDPQQGAVVINDADVRTYTLSSLRESMAIVSQHTFLFNDSVLENIRYGRHNASDEDVIAVAKAANAHDFITRLPDGYQTKIGEQGLTLSGGERQRVAIARALLKNAPLLILDEATAALDSESERLVQQAIDTLVHGRTVIVIAHRLATVRQADQIAVVARGNIVETGTQEQLLRLNGEYANLHRIQFADEAPRARIHA